MHLKTKVKYFLKNVSMNLFSCWKIPIYEI